MQKTIRVAKRLFRETIYIHKIIKVLFAAPHWSTRGQDWPETPLTAPEVSADFTCCWEQTVAFESSPRSQEASLVLALQPSVPMARLQGTGKGHVGSLPAPGACEGTRGDVQCVVATRGHGCWQPGIFGFGVRKARAQLQRAKETPPPITAFFSMERHQSKL